MSEDRGGCCKLVNKGKWYFKMSKQKKEHKHKPIWNDCEKCKKMYESYAFAIG